MATRMFSPDGQTGAQENVFPCLQKKPCLMLPIKSGRLDIGFQIFLYGFYKKTFYIFYSI